MKVNDLHFVSEEGLIPFYSVDIGSTFQIYTWIPIEVKGQKAYLSTYLKKIDNIWSSRTNTNDEQIILLDQKELVKQISLNEDTKSSKN